MTPTDSLLALTLSLLLTATAVIAQPSSPGQRPLEGPIRKLESELVQRYGEAQRARLLEGMRQTAEFWRAEDGDALVLRLVETEGRPSAAVLRFATSATVREANLLEDPVGPASAPVRIV